MVVAMSDDASKPPEAIPRYLSVPRGFILDGFAEWGGVNMLIRTLLRAKRVPIAEREMVDRAITEALSEKEPIELSIKVGSRGTWTMALTADPPPAPAKDGGRL